jgi:hypothetical protein
MNVIIGVGEGLWSRGKAELDLFSVLLNRMLLGEEGKGRYIRGAADGQGGGKSAAKGVVQD